MNDLHIFYEPLNFRTFIFWISRSRISRHSTSALGFFGFRGRDRAKARHVRALIAGAHVEFRPLQRTEKHWWPSYVVARRRDAMHLPRSPRQHSRRSSSLLLSPSPSVPRHSGIRFANRDLFAKSRQTVQTSFFKRFALSARPSRLDCLIALRVIGPGWLA